MEALTPAQLRAQTHHLVDLLATAAINESNAEARHGLFVAWRLAMGVSSTLAALVPPSWPSEADRARLARNRARHRLIVATCSCFRRTYGGGAGLYDHARDCAAHAAVQGFDEVYDAEVRS